MTSRRRSGTALQPDPSIKKALEDAQWTFGSTTESDVYELRLNLATPAVVTAEKANAPVIGLPTLDGFLSYVAFRAALGSVLGTTPQLSQQLLWQLNVALRDRDMWIEFQLPLRQIRLTGLPSLFDCSVGLPIDGNGELLTPTGAFFTLNGGHFGRHPEVVDSIPLRRRVNQPFGRPIQLRGKLDASSGPTKALDNRLYFPLTKSYVFFFRGDKNGVERLLNLAVQERIGLGKKTTLGYGQIASFEVNLRSDVTATWARSLSGPLFGNDRLALIKNLPYDRVFARRDISDAHNQQLFGCGQFALVATIETFGTYRPPYWLREQRTQIVRYGSIIQRR